MRLGLATLGLAAAGLMGCDIAAGLSGSDAPVRSMALMGGDAVVQAPDGYCIDQQSSRARSGFVVMAGCALVSEQAEMPFRDGLITVQVGEEGTAGVAGAEAELRALLGTAAGVGLLSSSGDPSSISIDTLTSQSNLVLVHFTDTAPPPFDGLEQVEWRAFFDLGDRISTVTVRGFERAPLSVNGGLGLLEQTVRAIQTANAAMAAANAAESTEDAEGDS